MEVLGVHATQSHVSGFTSILFLADTRSYEVSSCSMRLVETADQSSDSWKY